MYAWFRAGTRAILEGYVYRVHIKNDSTSYASIWQYSAYIFETIIY